MKTIYLYVALIACSTLGGCEKEFLEKKSDKALLVPTRMTDFQTLLDNLSIMNEAPYMQMIASDNFTITDAGYTGLSVPSQRNSYAWTSSTSFDFYGGSRGENWEDLYTQIFYANVVLDGLDKIRPNEGSRKTWEQLRGSALFYRGLAYYNLAQLFAEAYDKNTASKKLGIPLRLTSDVNVKSTRGNLQQTYDQILKDLTEAEELLSGRDVDHKNRPSEAAVKGLLARIYLSMGEYEKARLYAESFLRIENTLIDYNAISASAALPFPQALPRGNEEVVFYSSFFSSFGLSSLTSVDKQLYDSYTGNDLRKTIFFNAQGNGIVNFKGHYTGITWTFFGGLAVDEIYLILAECEARRGDAPKAMAYLNTLLEKRWRKGTFAGLTASDSEDALAIVLLERRKELVGRGLRWTDLRRLNKDNRFARTLTRQLNGQTITLSPGDRRYVFPIPENEIAISGIEQNLRN